MSPYEEAPSRGLNAAVAATLNGERTAAGMTFEQLAARTGLSKQTLMRLLSTRKRHLTIATVEAIAEVFGMTVPEVFARAQERMTRPTADVRADADTIRRAVRRRRSSPPDRPIADEGDTG